MIDRRMTRAEVTGVRPEQLAELFIDVSKQLGRMSSRARTGELSNARYNVMRAVLDHGPERMSRIAGADTTRVREKLADSTGLDLEKDLIPSFSGNVGIGVYLDAASLVDAVSGAMRHGYVLTGIMASLALILALSYPAKLGPATQRRLT